MPSKGNRSCSAPNCTNFRGKIANLSFFKFPKDVERCRIWIKNSAREDLFKRDISVLHARGLCLCAEHFDVSMFMNPQVRNKLIFNAVPTIFENSEHRHMILMPQREPCKRKRSHSSRKRTLQSAFPTENTSSTNRSNSDGSHDSSGGITNVNSWNGEELPPEDFEASPRDPGHGPEAAAFEGGPYRPRAFELPCGYFPKRKFGQSCRSFQESWYLQYPWLEYSIVKDAAYCYYCRLFSAQLPFRPERPFVFEGYRYWKNASLDMRLHNTSKVHLQSKTAYEHRLRGLGDGEGSAQQYEFHAALIQEMQDHRHGIAKVIDIVLFLGRLGLLFDKQYSDAEGSNRFLEFLKWRAREDTDLVPCISRPLLFANLLNRDELTQLCVDSVRRGIASDVNELADGYFSLICDEFVDVKFEKHISLCVRYVTKHLHIYERFMGHWRVDKIDDEAICTYLEAIFSEVGLCPDKLRGLSFSVFGTRTQRWRDVEVKMKESHPMAPVVGCYIRSFQHAFRHACSHVKLVCATLNAVDRFYDLLSWSPSCRSLFGAHPSFQEADIWQRSRRSSEKHWASSSLKCLQKLKDNMSVVVDGLEQLISGGGFEAVDADDVLHRLQTFDFIFCLNICTTLSAMLEDLGAHFQDPSITIDGTIDTVQNTVASLGRMKSKEGFTELLRNVKREAKKLGIEIPALEHKSSESNSESVEDAYYEAYVEACESIEKDLTEEFSNNSYELLVGMDHLITNRLSAVSERQDNHHRVLEWFPDDFDREKLMNDLTQFYDTVECDSESAKTDLKTVSDIAVYFVSNNFASEFPELHRLLKFYLLLPWTCPHPEKSFSVFKRWQVFQQTTSLERQLDDSAVLAIENEEALKLAQLEILEGLVDKYAERIFQSQFIYENADDAKSDVIMAD